MSSRLERVYRKGLITPPKFLISNMHYEVQMGSVAYGVSNDNSDMDIYGFAIPPKHIVFPHHDGVIFGFDKNFPKFDQFQQHHIKDDKIEYDFSIYNIVKFFRLVSDNNPNMLDALFVPRRCVLYSSEIGEMVRERRKIFLHKGSFHKLKGYAYSQLHKMKTKKPEVGSRRYYGVKEVGYDLKFAYHIVRLINQAEQILMEGDLDLERSREQLKSIRRGEWAKEQITEYFERKEKQLEETYHKSDAIPHSPNEQKIKKLLVDCLEQHYGSLSNLVKKDDSVYEEALREIENIVSKTIR